MKSIYFIATLLCFSSCKQKQELIHPVVRDITESVYASGIVKSIGQYEVYPRVPGIITKVHFKEGDLVRKGVVVITLANEAAKLAEETAMITSLYNSPALNSEKLEDLKMNIQVAKANMLNDSIRWQRQQRLWQEEIGTRNELEQRELNWRNAVSYYESAVLRYRALQKQIQYAALTSGKQLAVSAVVANDYLIRAHEDGKIYSLLKEAGEMVNTQSPVAVIGDPENFLLELRVDEYDISKVKVGQKVFISMDSHKGDVFEGRVDRIIPIMNPGSRSFTLEAVFTKVPAGLYPNLTVEANILICSKNHVVTIPRNYLTPNNQVILKNGSKRKVITGMKDYQLVEIVSGLSASEVIRKPSEEK